MRLQSIARSRLPRSYRRRRSPVTRRRSRRQCVGRWPLPPTARSPRRRSCRRRRQAFSSHTRHPSGKRFRPLTPPGYNPIPKSRGRATCRLFPDPTQGPRGRRLHPRLNRVTSPPFYRGRWQAASAPPPPPRPVARRWPPLRRTAVTTFRGSSNGSSRAPTCRNCALHWLSASAVKRASVEIRPPPQAGCCVLL